MILKNLRKLCENATPGPWMAEHGVSQRMAWAIKRWAQGTMLPVIHLDDTRNIEASRAGIPIEANIDFILTARGALPLLLMVAEEAYSLVTKKTARPSQFFVEALEQLRQYDAGIDLADVTGAVVVEPDPNRQTVFVENDTDRPLFVDADGHVLPGSFENQPPK